MVFPVQVVGFARREDRVKELAAKLTGKPGKLFPLKCDVSDEAQVVNSFQWIRDNLGPVHILVNNAGHTAETNLINGDAKLWKGVLDTNILGKSHMLLGRRLTSLF